MIYYKQGQGTPPLLFPSLGFSCLSPSPFSFLENHSNAPINLLTTPSPPPLFYYSLPLLPSLLLCWSSSVPLPIFLSPLPFFSSLVGPPSPFASPSPLLFLLLLCLPFSFSL